jgi:hypothetical protein
LCWVFSFSFLLSFLPSSLLFFSFFFSFCFLWYWGLNSGPTLCQPFFVMGFFEIGSENYLSRLALNHDSPDLCLSSSWDYRHESPVPGNMRIFSLIV